MKPIQNQYQDLLEGKMSKHNFLNNVKSTLSQYVSKGNSYEDAISILKSKKILSENISNTAQMGGVTASKGTAGYIDSTGKKGGDYDPKERASNLSKLKKFGLKKEELKVVKEPNPNAGKYQITTHKNEPVNDKYFDTMNDATDFARKQNYSFEIKIQKVSPQRSMYRKVSENKKQISEISASTLKPNSRYEYSGGAENTVLKYVGKREDNPNIKVGSSMSKGHIFQWPDGKYFELGPLSVMKYIEFSDTDEFDTDEYSQEISNRYDREQEKHALPGGNMLEKKNSFDEVLDRLSEGKYTLNKYINEIDSVNPIEYQNGISFEVDLAGDFSAEGLEKAVKKVLKNLKKDPIYYTNLKSSLGQKINKKIKSSEYTELKKDNQLDKHNQLKTLVKKEMANTKITQSKQEKASKATPKGVKLMKEEIDNNKYTSELSADNIRNIIKDTNRFYREQKTTVEKTSRGEIYVFMNGNRIVGDTRKVLEKLFNIREESEEIDTDRLPIYTYFISKKTTPNQNMPQKDNYSDEDIFENKDEKKRQDKDFENFSKKMIGKPTTKQNTIKDKIKEYVVKQLRKEAVKFTIGADKEYVSDTASKDFENKLRSAGVTKFTKSKVQ